MLRSARARLCSTYGMALLASRAVEEPVAVHGVVARQHEPSPVSRQVGVDLARQEGTAIELVRVAAREVVAKEAAARVAARDVAPPLASATTHKHNKQISYSAGSEKFREAHEGMPRPASCKR